MQEYFLDIRGIGGPESQHYEYNQSHMPPKQQSEAVGHAVRATYMYSGMADVAAIMGDKDYLKASDDIWQNMVSRKYYITGGIGALHSGEAFGANYELPNASAYNETCAAIANVYWNWRMFLLHGDSKYYDALERTLYNGVLSGISLSGDHFFYPNPLASSGGYARSEWFGCACCPSNLCRFMASVPGYAYAHKADSVYVNLFIKGSAHIPVAGDSIIVSQDNAYPWQGDMTISMDKAPKDVSQAELSSLFDNEISFAAVEPSGAINGNSTANAPGHWFARDGHVVSWVSSPNLVTNTSELPLYFSEFNKYNYSLSVGQYPQQCKHGDVFHFRQALTRIPSNTNGQPHRVVIDVKLGIGVDTGIRDVKAGTSGQSQATYDLRGIRRSDPAKAPRGSVLIQGGHKSLKR